MKGLVHVILLNIALTLIRPSGSRAQLTTGNGNGSSSGNESSNGILQPLEYDHLWDDAGVNITRSGDSLVPYKVGRVSEGETVAQLLALDMLNRGDGSIVKELKGINERCPIRFTGEFVDSFLTPSLAVDQLMDVLQRKTPESQQICAVFGPVRSAASIPTGILTGVKGIPQLTKSSKTSELDDKSQFPYFGRLGTSDEGDAFAYIMYLKKYKIEYVGVIHVNDSLGNAYARALLKIAAEIYPELKLTVVDLPSQTPTQKDYEETIQVIRRSGLKWVFVVLVGSRDFQPLLHEAERQGISGSGQHVWQFASTVGKSVVEGLVAEKGSPLAKSAIGIGIVGSAGGRTGEPVFDAYETKFRELLNDQDLQYIQSKMPSYPDYPDFEPEPIDERIDTAEAVENGALAFDSIIMFGLAACKAFTDSPLHLDGPTMFAKILETSFRGASGNVTLHPVTGTRDPSSILNLMHNHRPVQYNDTHVTFERVISEAFISGGWMEEIPYMYNDGTTDLLPDLPPFAAEYNYIGTALRIVGLAMAVLVMGLSCTFATWVIVGRKEYVVKASQPIFLLILCMGAFFMGLSIVPLSLDDEILDDEGASSACMAAPWLLSTGFVMVFAALFAKTWRVNRIFNNPGLKRVKVTTFDVIRPLVILLVLNIIILVTWTKVSPLKWIRRDVAEDSYGRVIESRGLCDVDDCIAFVGTIVILDFGALLFASYQSYLARGISTEFAESEYIGRSIACMLLACFVGIPTVIIVYDEPRGEYFVKVSIIFVLSCSVLLFIFVPKILFARKNSGASGFKSTMKNASARSKKNASRSDFSGHLTCEAKHVESSPPSSSHEEDNAFGISVIDTRQAYSAMQLELKLQKARIVELETKLKEKNSRTRAAEPWQSSSE